MSEVTGEHARLSTARDADALQGASTTESASTERYALHLTHVFVPAASPAAVGSLVTLDLRLSPDLVVPMRARVLEHGESSSEGRGMRLVLLGPIGEHRTEQLATTLREADASPRERISFSSLCVLVVDDDEHYRAAAADAIAGAGFEVLLARNGLEGLSLAVSRQPAAIISDVTMPDMDGWQLLRVLRSRPTLRHTPVLFLTSLNSEAERLRGYQLGVDDYIPKPFSDVELLARVERALERSGSAHEAQSVRGDLTHVSLASLLSLAEMERRTGVLQLTRDDERAALYLRDGAVLRIALSERYDDLRGRERFFHLLDWEGGQFELTTTSVLIEDELSLSSTHVLLEHARLRDESDR